MKKTLVFGVAILGCVLCSCKPSTSTAPPVDPAYVAEISNWRAQRETRLQAPDGWLSLVGLYWLDEGDNSIGSDPMAVVFLDAPGIGPDLGTLRVDGGRVTLIPSPGAEITLAGKPVDGPTVLHTDADDGGPDKLRAGRLTAYVIARGDRLAVRVKDPEAPTRVDFKGLQYFPIDPEFRIEAHLEAAPEPFEVSVPTAVGTEDRMWCPGDLRFTIDGVELSLQPWLENPDDHELFIVFTDTTSGTETYGAGRFLYAELGDDGRAVLDFNKSYTPPCGFTPYATCPLAPPENRLPIAVTAGEKMIH